MDTALFLQEALGRLPTYANDALIECLGGGELCNMRMPKSKISNYWINVDALAEESPDPNQPRETIQAVKERLIPFLKDILEDHKGNVLIVSHHDVLRALTGKSLRNAEAIVLSREELATLLDA
jgi:broad specificity phosphatase PhoE